MYIYKTTNLINNKFYIGKSSRDIASSTDYYGSGKLINLAIKKYGRENFIKEIIDEATSLTELNIKEKMWILLTNAITNGYNLALGGDGGCDTEEQRLKIIETWNKKDLVTWGEKTSKHMHEYFNKYPKIMNERVQQMAAKSKDTVASFNILTKEYKRISTNEFLNNKYWVGMKWKGFYEVILPNNECYLVTKVNDINELCLRLGVKIDWITRRKNKHLPFIHSKKSHSHLDGTIINFHTIDEVNIFFKH